ncbi:hypothetical protein WAX74_03815 [Psychrobacillus sp. FJAT-51614]|uniref:N-acetyltransferase domain-containing protein n=1 Tax=Psychrobacillus mangrovi TaxID=3117745 RepID=A0ABU8F1B6_9BACI
MKISNVFIDFQIFLEEGTSIFNVVAKCLVYIEELSEPIKVGEASLYIFNPQKSSFLDTCIEGNCISADLNTLFISLQDICEIDDIPGMVAACNDLSIKEEWRENGLGQGFLEKIKKQLSYLNVQLLLVKLSTFISSSSIENSKDDLTINNSFYECKNGEQVIVTYRYLNDRNIVLVK